ncbi:tryptophan synthase subunit beta [Alistipes sp. OttesenSCG-928-B03]|nr:tryptophan synthase subunit beta [Alistipes sp. OttesenSCG-928-B03]
MNYNIDERGFYGEYGGAYIPDALRRNIEELRANYLTIMNEPDFREEFERLLRDYVGRPSPLYHAEGLSRRYGTRVYLKREDLNHTGAHKINNCIGQILLARRMGKRRIIAETGAGQHGVATATVCALMEMECVVYMGAADVARQALNVRKMEMLGARVVAVASGGRGLKEAVDEALADWCAHPADTHYIIGSAVGPHPFPDMVARFQSVISSEIRTQLAEKEGRDYPDYVVACVGGGSNAAGAFYHFLDDARVGLIECEAAGEGVATGRSAATLTEGGKGVMHGFRSRVMLTADGEVAEPYSISAGLDYPGIGPLHAHLADTGRAGVVAVTDGEALAAALELTRTEGIIPALESAHALAVLGKRRFGADDVVVINLSGRGDKDMDTYIAAFAATCDASVAERAVETTAAY